MIKTTFMREIATDPTFAGLLAVSATDAGIYVVEAFAVGHGSQVHRCSRSQLLELRDAIDGALAASHPKS